MEAKMNVFVTGVNGFIGRYIARVFQENGDTVIGCGLENDSNNPYLNGYFKWNIAYEDIPDEILNVKVDYIVHAASLIDSNDDNIELIYSNCVGTYRVYRLAKTIHVNSLVALSSVPISGLHCNKMISEETSSNPQTMYHATKAAQEFILNQLSKEGIRFCSLRIPSPIGPGQPEKTIVPVFVRKAMNNENIVLSGKGTRKQNYVDVRDIARCIYFLCNNASAHGTYVIGVDKTISNYELAELCIELTNSASDIKFNGNIDLCDNDDWKINRKKLNDCGFELKYNIRDTIKDMIDYNNKQL